MGNRRLNSIDSPLMKLLVTLTYASGEDVILSTIQLLRVALITRLLLLLIPLIILLIVTTLVAMTTLISLEPRVRAATTVTRSMKVGS